MNGLELDAIQARYNDWYAADEGDPLYADWSTRDVEGGETMECCIVRNDVPALIAEVDLLAAALRRIAPHEYDRLHSPKWSDMFGIDPEYTEGVPAGEWLDKNRGEA